MLFIEFTPITPNYGIIVFYWCIYDIRPLLLLLVFYCLEAAYKRRLITEAIPRFFIRIVLVLQHESLCSDL